MEMEENIWRNPTMNQSAQQNASSLTYDYLTWNSSYQLDESTSLPTEDPRYASHLCAVFYSFLINTLFAGLLCLFGFLGNSISYFVLSRDQNTSAVAAFLLQSLAFTDNFFLICWFVQFSLANAFTYTGADRRWLSPTWLYIRTYGYPLVFVGQTATIWLTVLIAASRHIAVCMPYRASVYCSLKVTQWSVASVLIFSFFYNIPRFFETTIVERYSPRLNATFLTYQRTPMGNSRLYQLVYFDILYYLFSFVLPLLLLSLFNTRLILAYRRVEQRRARMMRTRSRASQSHDQNITLIMIVVILVFMLCNAPARLVQIIWQYVPTVCPGWAYFLTVFSNVLEVFSSSTNFFIYCAFRKQFRQILRRRTRDALSLLLGRRIAEALLGRPADSGGEFSETGTAAGPGGKNGLAMTQTQVQGLEITCVNDVIKSDDDVRDGMVNANGNSGYDLIIARDVRKGDEVIKSDCDVRDGKVKVNGNVGYDLIIDRDESKGTDAKEDGVIRENAAFKDDDDISKDYHRTNGIFKDDGEVNDNNVYSDNNDIIKDITIDDDLLTENDDSVFNDLIKEGDKVKEDFTKKPGEFIITRV